GAATSVPALHDALPIYGGMSWYVQVPDKAKLTADLSDGACTVSVLATAEDGATAEGKLEGTGSAVDLSALAGKATRLDLDNTSRSEEHTSELQSRIDVV